MGTQFYTFMHILEAVGVGTPLLAVALIVALMLVALAGGMASFYVRRRSVRARDVVHPPSGSLAGEWDVAARRLAETTSDALLLLDRDGTILMANPTARAMLAHANGSDPVGRHITQAVDDPLFTRQFSRLARHGPVRDYEMTIPGEGGQARYLSVTTCVVPSTEYRVPSKNGQPLGTLYSVLGTNLLWVARDITQQKGRELASAEGEERYRAVVEGASEGIFLADIQTGRFLEANPAFTSMTGYSDIELRGMTLYNLQPHDHDGLERDLMRLLSDGRCASAERTYRRRDGSFLDVEVSAYSVMRAGREAMCGMVHDVSEKKRAREQLERRIVALRSIDAAIGSQPDLRVTLNVILDQVAALLQADAAAVLLLDPHHEALEYGAGCGFRDRGIEFSRLRLGEGHAGRAAQERSTVYVPDFATDGNGRAALLQGEDFASYYALPLVAKGQVKGVLEIFGRSPLHPHTDWIEFAEALAGQAAIAIDNASLLYELQRANMDLVLAYDSTLEGWSRALDLRDKETEGHTQRVTAATVRLAHAVGIGGDDLVHVRRGALLHDIGKMGVPDAILLKPGPLTDAEWRVMRLHPTYAYKMLSAIPFLRPAISIPYCHHERWDGSGYPRGLKREEIPLPARVFSVVDVWDALRSDRPYRKAWPEERVREHIASLSGTHFDPEIAQVFLNTTAPWQTPVPTVNLGRHNTAPLLL